MKLSFTCECGNVLRVSSAQCGGVTTCDCGKSVQIPSLSKLAPTQPTGLRQAQATSADDVDELSGAIRVALAHRGVISMIALQICITIGVKALDYFDPELALSTLPIALLLSWIVCLLLASYIFRILFVVADLTTAVIFALFAFIPFLNLAAALTCSVLSSRHLKRFGYHPGFWGLSDASVQELQSKYQRAKG